MNEDEQLTHRTTVLAWILIVLALVAAFVAGATGHWVVAALSGYLSVHMRWGLALSHANRREGEHK